MSFCSAVTRGLRRIIYPFLWPIAFPACLIFIILVLVSMAMIGLFCLAGSLIKKTLVG